jgi:hypothetical protein
MLFLTQSEIERKAKNDYEVDRDEIYEEYYKH